MERRFNNLKFLEQLRVFEPQRIRNLDSDKVQNHGVNEIKMIVQILNSHYFKTEDSVDLDGTLADWATTKHLIRGDWSHFDDEKVESTLIMHPTFKGIAKIYEFINVIPLTCIASFSIQYRQKVDSVYTATIQSTKSRYVEHCRYFRRQKY
jgi:hypothetical protein